MTNSQPDFLPFAVPDIGEEEIAAVVETLRSGWLTTGPCSAAFETEFAAAIAPGKIAVAVNSATAGLHLALEAIGIGPGDEVLVPTWTFTASAEVVRYLGADPILVDVEPTTLNLSFEAADAAVTPRTRAVIPVHFAGLPVSRLDLENFAAHHSLKVVEDAAHALPAISDGVTVGDARSEATVFSFYATKTITTGEGGMLLTGDPEIAARARTMRLHGINRDVFGRYQSKVPSWQYEVVAPGFKYNLSDPAAAIGRVQLRRAVEMRDKRAAIASRYDEQFVDLRLTLPAHVPPGGMHAWHLYVVRLEGSHPSRRDDFIAQMADLGVGCSVHFMPLHMHPYWRDQFGLEDSNFPVASSEFERAVSLPIFSGMSEGQVDRVIEAVRKVAR